MTFSRCCNTTNSNPQSAVSSQPAPVRRGLYLWLVAVLLALPTWSFADDRAKAQALVERAAAASRLSDLKSAYTFKISFRVPGEHGTVGTFQYWSVSPFHWRTEIKARGYNETEVGEPDRRWVAADLPYVPDPIETLTQLITTGTTLDWKLDTSDVRVKKERDGECVEVKPRKKYKLDICFDPATSLLRSLTDNEAHRSEYLDYQAIEGRQVPRKMNAYDSGYLVVEAKLDLLATLPAPDPALLQPPPKAEAWDWCEHMEPPRMIRGLRPVMPRGAPGGENRFWLVIGTDGRVEEGGLIESAGRPLDRAAAEAMKHWLFRPAMCNGMPIRAKTTASFMFQY